MTLPTIHLNGTSKQALIDAIDLACASLQTALRDLGECAPNPRDYYPQGPNAFGSAVAEHESRTKRVHSVIVELGHLARAIGDQGRR